MLLQDKVALVTGGGSGIGRATALVFARDGARVVVVDRNESAAREVADSICRLGGEAIAVTADVSREDDVRAMVQASLDAYGALHAASNNAARGGGFSLIPDTEEHQWNAAQDVTLKGVWLCMKHQIPAMRASGGGAIVNIASLSGIRGEALQASYSAAKGGVIALTKTAAAENARGGIRVNAVAPGGVLTPALEDYFEKVPGAREHTASVHAMRRLGEPGEIADAVSYLLSDRASFITGHVLNVDGGLMVNPHVFE